VLLGYFLDTVVVVSVGADSRKHIAHRISRSRYEEEHNQQVAGLLLSSSQSTTREPNAPPTAFGPTAVGPKEGQASQKQTVLRSIVTCQKGATPRTSVTPKTIVVASWHCAGQVTIEPLMREAEMPTA
jgi:hypothetical protein